MNRYSKLKWIGVLAVLFLAVSACSTQIAVPGEVVADAPSVPADQPAPTPAVAEEAAQPPATEPAVVQAPRTELEATDPGSVVLASGQPQLVEFFAYW